MRRSRRASREPEVDPFYDMLFNMLIAFVFCFIVALLAMNPQKTKAGDVPAKAEYIITVSWPDNDPNDLDAWVQGPGGDVVWFRQREAGLLHLDRDDRGVSNDTAEPPSIRSDTPFVSLSAKALPAPVRIQLPRVTSAPGLSDCQSC